MSSRRSLLAAVVLIVAAAVVVGCVWGLGAGADPSSGAGDAAHTNARAGAARESSQGRPGTSPSAATESRPTPSGATPGSAPTARGGVRIVPEAPGAGSEYRLPDLGDAPPAPLPSRADLPNHAVFARGRLVGGFPARLLPRAPGSSVVSSSVSPSKDRVQVALVGVPAGAGDGLLGFYRAELSAAGFREIPVRAVAGSSAAAFARGASRVVVTLEPAASRRFSVYASLVVGRA